MSRILLITGFIVLMVACDGVNNRPDEFSAYDSARYERVSINYEIYGSQDTSLIFIHGWNLNMRYWDEQVKYFKPNYRILNIDLAGHGNSGRDRTNWTVESLARDITNIMEKESINKAILIGHSMGGAVALQVWENVPDKVIQIVGVDCFKNVEFELTDEFKNGFRDHLSKFKRNYSEMADEYARQNIRSKDRTIINRIVRDYRNADPKIALAVYRNVVNKSPVEKEKIQRLPFQLFIIGSDYTPINENALSKYAKLGYEVIPVYGAGHFPMVEQPRQMNAALDTVFRKVRDRYRPEVHEPLDYPQSGM
jgi:sigma-B regulation protein RsbQ